MKRVSARTAAALPWLIACLHAHTWADPMRPLVLPAAASAPGAAPVAERAGRSPTAETPKEPERLVAIRQDSNSRWLALFGERWVKAGDKLDSYTVASVDANSVQLTEGKQRRTLHLLPPLSPPTEPPQTKTAALSPHRAQGLPTP